VVSRKLLLRPKTYLIWAASFPLVLTAAWPLGGEALALVLLTFWTTSPIVVLTALVASSRADRATERLLVACAGVIALQAILSCFAGRLIGGC
jgi:threonine/homoserine/homoserine lactone efflux protein